MIYRREGPTGRSGVGVRALAFKTIGHGFAPRQRFVFFTRRRRRRVSIYKSYIGGLPPASALSFSHVDVGDPFQFINDISLSLSPLSDIGDAFASRTPMPLRPVVPCSLSATYDLCIEKPSKCRSGVVAGRCRSQP